MSYRHNITREAVQIVRALAADPKNVLSTWEHTKYPDRRGVLVKHEGQLYFVHASSSVTLEVLEHLQKRWKEV